MKSNKVLFYFILLLATAFVFNACYKEGHGGKASIIVSVRHEEGTTNHLVRGAAVCIKYGASDSPGSDCSAYDESKVADTTYAKASFTNLYKGDYYIFADGIDTVNVAGVGITTMLVNGGIAVTIKKRTEVVEVTVITKKKK